MNELTDALEKLSDTVESLKTSLETVQKCIAGLQAQIDGQSVINAKVEKCLRLLLGVEKEPPKLSIVAPDEPVE